MSGHTDAVTLRLEALTHDFAHYVDAYDELAPFNTRQLTLHRETVARRRKLGGVLAAVHDDQFVASLRETLKAWGIGVRGSRMVSEKALAEALRTAAPGLVTLEKEVIDASSPEVVDQLWLIIESLAVVSNQAKVVAGTKTLHHLLPDLVPPLDRQWTGTFFGYHPPEWQPLSGQRKIFIRIYNALAAVAHDVDPDRYVTGRGWRTSRSKILDNAVIAFCQHEQQDRPTAPSPGTISFDIEGLPPAKNEALSIFGVNHSHATRVEALLRAAQAASQEQGFTSVHSGPVALEVVVSASPGAPPWDATNYLGGIADVLEDKANRGPLPHLRELAKVWLYRNDRQIKQIAYREVSGNRATYRVTIRRLDS